jgi:hypothetical protein
MKIDKYIVRRMDNLNIVVHIDKGKHKDGSYRTDDNMTSHGTLESALRNLRIRLRSYKMGQEGSLESALERLEKLDEWFINELKNNCVELKEMI